MKEFATTTTTRTKKEIIQNEIKNRANKHDVVFFLINTNKIKIKIKRVHIQGRTIDATIKFCFTFLNRTIFILFASLFNLFTFILNTSTCFRYFFNGKMYYLRLHEKHKAINYVKNTESDCKRKTKEIEKKNERSFSFVFFWLDENKLRQNFMKIMRNFAEKY